SDDRVLDVDRVGGRIPEQAAPGARGEVLHDGAVEDGPVVGEDAAALAAVRGTAADAGAVAADGGVGQAHRGVDYTAAAADGGVSAHGGVRQVDGRGVDAAAGALVGGVAADRAAGHDHGGRLDPAAEAEVAEDAVAAEGTVGQGDRVGGEDGAALNESGVVT